MPTYQYRCHDCRHELEAQQSFSDDPLSECPSCGGTLKKRFSSVGISFKGSGFYKTDSRGSSSRSTSPADSSTETSSGSDSSSGATPAAGSSDTGSSGSGGSTSPAATAASA